jgi:DNA-binding response OmpR family regulator
MANLDARGVRLVRFGPFELDARAGELRKHGIRLLLREQPFRILLLLLEHSGEIVLREEIRLKLGQTTPLSNMITASMQLLRSYVTPWGNRPNVPSTLKQ